MLAVQPKWVEKIANGQKTIEVRKTAPKCEVPFKCYIYCTKSTRANVFHLYINGGIGRQKFGITGHWRSGKKVVEVNPHLPAYRYNSYLAEGKVIGEFVCDSAEWMSMRDCDKACMTLKEAVDYSKGKKLYAWHISDLKIYDKPKELHEFKRECPKTSIKRADCITCPFEYYEPRKRVSSCDAYLKRPPQSWQYVEELQE